MDLTARNPISCLICGSDHAQFLCLSRTQRVPSLKTPISICRDCGFVYINPRWTREQYDEVMDRWYPHKFILDPPTDPSEDKRFVKWIKMDERIAPYYPNGVRNLLDVGAGQGWCIEYLKRKCTEMNAFAIERWEPCQKHIQENYNGVIIGEKIDAEWDPQYHNRFDLIVFRHTLEHIFEPLPVLKQLREYLSDDGYAYIVVPSIRETTRILQHSYFRPVHVSYFCKETLESLARQAGLEPVVMEEKRQKELWCLFKRGETAFIKPNVYEETMQIIATLQKQEWLKSAFEFWHINLLHWLDVTHIRPMPKKQHSTG